MSQGEMERLASLLDPSKRIVVLTGAGISAESGIPTFRGPGGLWRQFRPEDLATLEAFRRDPKLVWEWYDWRRSLIARVEPNPGHRILAQWEKRFSEFTLITQNVDGLHELAGSRRTIELHGNIWKTRCTRDGSVMENRKTPLSKIPPLCPGCGSLLRPHIVWFGEPLDAEEIDRAFLASSASQVMFVVGTSAVVHPAASLPLAAAEGGAVIVEINPDPTPLTSEAGFSFRGTAGGILPGIDEILTSRWG